MQQVVNIKKAVILGVISSLLLSLMAVCVKLAVPYTNNNMTIFFRFTISFIYIMLIFGFKRARGETFPIKTEHLGLHIFRAVISVTGMLLFYYSLKYISLINGNLLVMTNPLFIPILLLIFFHKKTNLKSWLAILIGFMGVALVMKPGHDLFNPMSIYALLSGVCGAFIIVAVRLLSKVDHPHTSMFYYFTLAFFAGLIISIFHWKTPNLHAVLLLLGVGIFGTAYQECLIRTAMYASAKMVSVLLYVSIIFSGLLGWIFWGEIPDLLSWIGILLVFLGSVLVILNEKTEMTVVRQ